MRYPRKPALSEKHYQRALEQIATHRCNTDLTDGFCGPDRDPVRCRQQGRHRDCVLQAEGILDALASRGIAVVWVFDKELPDDLAERLRALFE